MHIHTSINYCITKLSAQSLTKYLYSERLARTVLFHAEPLRSPWPRNPGSKHAAKTPHLDWRCTVKKSQCFCKSNSQLQVTSLICGFLRDFFCIFNALFSKWLCSTYVQKILAEFYMNPDVVMRLTFSKYRIRTKGKIERLTSQVPAAGKKLIFTEMDQHC